MERTLNLGILAHVDAGKTSLTEQILWRAGVTAAPGRVDHGTTQTDTLALERDRGITIQSAVVSFRIGDLAVNLIDTPGHPDFIAEVERALGVLDAVVLVVSAVEGVQPQTRRLARAIADLDLPCLIFVNKIDRAGARGASLIDEIARELPRDLVVLTSVTGSGTDAAQIVGVDFALPDIGGYLVDQLSRHDDVLLAQFLAGSGGVGESELRAAMRRQVAGARVMPVVHGSAMTGAGIDLLLSTIADLLPPAKADAAALAAEVFKVQRLASGERVVLCRIWGGTMDNRGIVPIVRPHAKGDSPHSTAKITGIDGFRDGGTEPRQHAEAGEIVRLHGLHDARIGDWLGRVIHARVPAFDPPVFESLIAPERPSDQVQFNTALAELVDQDPLISVRRDARSNETYVRLHGEVQQEVIGATLATDYGVAVTFGEPGVVCVERLMGSGSAAEIFPDTQPPFYATVGFRVRPMEGDRSSWRFTPGKAKQGFFDAAEEGGRSVLDQGVYGWPVVDWDVEVTDLIYLVNSAPADYRRLAMLVMATAIRKAGTVVCEPVYQIAITTPPEAVGAVIHAVSSRRGVVHETGQAGALATVTGTLPATEMAPLTRVLPGLTNGRADIASRLHGYVPVEGEPPVRRRTDLNPFDRTEFLSRLAGRF